MKTMADNKDKKVLNVPALRFTEFTGEWEIVSLKDIAVVNPKSEPLLNKFFYIDLESVEKGELKKSVLQSLKEFQARAKAQEQKEMATEKSKAHEKGDVEL